MATLRNSASLKFVLGLSLLLPAAGIAGVGVAAYAQAPAAAHQLGTVKAVSGDTVTISTDAGQTITVNVASSAKVMQLAVGSTDLKTATPSQVSDIAVGDRVLAVGTAGSTPSELTATRVILMKSGDIAKKNAEEEADWRNRGVGGIVNSVNPSAGAITLEVGKKKMELHTSPKTEFLRFAGDSVKFQDARPGTLAEVHAGDQLQARGDKSEDGTSMQAEEVVSGSFKNLSGLIASVDPAAGVITLKDLASKKMMTVKLTANSDIRALPARAAMMFAARAHGESGGGRRSGGGERGGAEGQGRAGEAGAGRSAGADLSQMISRLPKQSISDLHKGDAVMIVASEPAPGSDTDTAVTVLTGVEPILTANPNGGMNLSAWNMGGNAPTE